MIENLYKDYDMRAETYKTITVFSPAGENTVVPARASNIVDDPSRVIRDRLNGRGGLSVLYFNDISYNSPPTSFPMRFGCLGVSTK